MIFSERCDGGTHATTRLAAAALRRLCPERSVLDVGTGDGHLAAIAVRCGARDVRAIDRDPHAPGVVAPPHRVAASVGDILAVDLDPTPSDIVVANLPDPLVASALPALAARCRATLIVTGARLFRARRLARELRALGFAPDAATALDGWCCITALRNG